jgi:single-stranded-DNA-specific exonuclease
MKFTQRDIPPRSLWALEQAGVHPLLARLFAARGVHGPQDLDPDLAHLLPLQNLKGVQEAAVLLADAIARQAALCIVADYDCDGATACAVALRGLRMLGAKQVRLCRARPRGRWLWPDPAHFRARQSPEAQMCSSRWTTALPACKGWHGRANLGLQVLVTDHHLPAAPLPEADVIVNPNQPGCTFPSKSARRCGCDVLCAAGFARRAAQARRVHAPGAGRATANWTRLLPLVALGTVADVVKLDANNRRLVAQGLEACAQRANARGHECVVCCSRAPPEKCTSQDFGFAVGPRINAAGRLSDMTLGIECLQHR